MNRRLFGAYLMTAVCVGVLSAEAQVRRAQQGPPQVQVAIDLTVAGEQYRVNGQGTCTHAPQAAIYNVRSQLRTARHSAEGRSLQLTFWDPLDGSEDMFSLSVSVPGKSSTVSTVRGGKVEGSGKVTFEAAGKGGAFRIDAKAADGRAISGTVKCDLFAPHAAEGGND